MSTDTGGNVTVNQGYYAYGRYRSGGVLPTDRRYTGQQRDDTGLYYYNARYYDPLLGTFLSPDTLVPDPGNVQAYNRYLYALGNPIRYNDPSGHCVTSVLSGGGTAALDLACLEALGVASEAAPPVAAAGATAAVGAGAYLAASWAMQDNGPTVPPIQPERLPGDDFTVTIPVPNSSTVTSGVPLGTGMDTSVPGITANTGPTLRLVDPLPETQTIKDLISPSMTKDQKALKEVVDETTQGGRKPLTVNEAETILDWADEVNYPGWRAKPGDVTYPSNWIGRIGHPNEPHIHIPGVGSGHIPVPPGVSPR